MPPPANDDDDEGARQRANIAVLVAAIVLVVGGVWLMLKFKESSTRLDCHAARHQNCDPAPGPASQ